MIRWLGVAVLGVVLSLMGGATAHAQTERPLRVLYLSQSVGFVHETVRRPPGGLAPSELALQAMAADSGAFVLELSQDARELTPERLARLDVLMFSTTGALPISRETWNAVTAWIESGRGGFVGVHSAADTQLDFENGEAIFTAFLGGQFDGHPWTQGTPIRLSNLDPAHPLAVMWPDGADFAEEIYQYSGFEPDRVRVLQMLDMTGGTLRRPYPVPVAWVRQVGQGRLFYTNLGHTPSTWDDPRFRDQIVSAIRWAGHRIEGPTSPNRVAQDTAALAAFATHQSLTVPSTIDPALADQVRALQPVHPRRATDRHDAFDCAMAALRDRLR